MAPVVGTDLLPLKIKLGEALANAGRLAGFEVMRRFYEIGTPEGLAETDRHLRETMNVSDYTKSYYEEVGAGRTMLMLHGWTGDHRHMFDEMEPVFVQRAGWRRLAIHGLQDQA